MKPTNKKTSYIPSRVCAPGRILLEEFLKPLNIDPINLAEKLDIPTRTLLAFIRDEINLPKTINYKLGELLGPSPEFWINLQQDYDNSIHRE